MFKKIKRILACNVLFAYTDLNKELKIHTDARKLKLGAVISQYGKPIYLYSRKLTDN